MLWGNPKAGDDLEDVRWFSVENAHNYLHPTHMPLLNAVRNFLALKAEP